MGLKDHSYVVFDVETTGLYPYSGDRICEIGAVKLSPCGGKRLFESLVDPQWPISPAAFAVNGITKEMLKGQPTIDKVLPNFLKFIEGSVLVAYNSSFDLGFIECALGYKEHILNQFQVIDALKLARKLFPDAGKYNLVNVANHLGISTEGSHRALQDAWMTAKIFEGELKLLIKHGVEKIEEISEPRKQREVPIDLCSKKILDQMEKAIIDKTSLEITYQSVWNNKITSRTITPKEIRKGYDKFYVIAFCHLRKKERNFRLDCIVDAKS